MSPHPSSWARWQLIWGVLFAVTALLSALWLLSPFSGERNPPGSAPTPTAAAFPAVDALADAQATLGAAADAPVTSMPEVMAAAETVVAATTMAESVALIPPPETPETPIETSPSLLQQMVGSVPALTTLITFAGLIFTSLMKWRSDLRDNERVDRELEQRRLEFELERQRHDLERTRASLALEREKFELELERKRLELRKLEDELTERIRKGAATG